MSRTIKILTMTGSDLNLIRKEPDGLGNVGVYMNYSSMNLN
jgi:hypothetical protein